MRAPAPQRLRLVMLDCAHTDNLSTDRALLGHSRMLGHRDQTRASALRATLGLTGLPACSRAFLAPGKHSGTDPSETRHDAYVGPAISRLWPWMASLCG